MRKSSRPVGQMGLPGVISVGPSGSTITVRGAWVPHKKILEALDRDPSGRRGIVAIYREEVLPIKTRSIQLLGRKGKARILKTLLGYEVQASYKRIHCPDMVTARYVKLFSELGCRTIKLPYDPTVTERLMPELERALDTILSGVRQIFPDDPVVQGHVIRSVFRLIRALLKQEGASA